MPITPADPFQWRQYPGEVILLWVCWYLRFPLSFAHVAELISERGLAVDRNYIWRWVQEYGPELNKRCRPHLKPANKSWRVDETYLKVKGKDRYLSRAVDATGQTIPPVRATARVAGPRLRLVSACVAHPAGYRSREQDAERERQMGRQG